MSKIILIGILISVIIIPLGNSFSQLSKNQTSEVVVVDGPEAKANLDRFDKLDFEAWNKNNWTLYKEIHSPDVLVVDFDGKVTNGIDQHLKWSNESQSTAPSTITAHPIKLGIGNWTAVTGNINGTILSTGETFNSTMVTVAHWKDGRIIEEYLFMH
jgi:SnoaL-like domain